MAGNGKRFFDAGYDEIKYKLRLGGKSILTLCLEPFALISIRTPIVLAYNPKHANSAWIIDQCSQAGLYIPNVVLIDVEDATLGQAHTAAMALRLSAKGINTRFAITNIDTVYTNAVDFTEIYQTNLSFILCARFEGDHWSFVKTDATQQLTEIAEKQRISNLCTTGYYQFASSEMYLQAFDRIVERRSQGEKSEIYVSHVYHEILIEHDIKVGEVDRWDVVLCGTPAEYEKANNEN